MFVLKWNKMLLMKWSFEDIGWCTDMDGDFNDEIKFPKTEILCWYE